MLPGSYLVYSASVWSTKHPSLIDQLDQLQMTSFWLAESLAELEGRRGGNLLQGKYVPRFVFPPDVAIKTGGISYTVPAYMLWNVALNRVMQKNVN